ncbi:hypothetical protein Q75_06480 [Bacillus coahuilensis p1.1.43]|uniref:Immunity protein n=1 Tax=Bacillus coahuilensis p1.1.43 TaxID=1150625 RepID=A0A147K9P4_9BACI|nr:hypothetical protein [Bacillus coahuilensis]KUP07168.1 hypothetical protein Q75_06480 [Bacillus coahuilensis p1.1.43]
MNLLWGVLMVIAGLFLLVFGTVKSDFIVYRLLVARSKILWGDKVHLMHQISGGIIIVLGVLWTLGLIWSK